MAWSGRDQPGGDAEVLLEDAGLAWKGSDPPSGDVEMLLEGELCQVENHPLVRDPTRRYCRDASKGGRAGLAR
jgi:hypothetical protein